MFPCFFFAQLSTRFLTHIDEIFRATTLSSFFCFWHCREKTEKLLVFPETDFRSFLSLVLVRSLTRIRRTEQKGIFIVVKFKRVEKIEENLQSCKLNLHVPHFTVEFDGVFSCDRILKGLICLDYFTAVVWFDTFINASDLPFMSCELIIKLGNNHRIWHRHNYQLLIISFSLNVRFSYNVAWGDFKAVVTSLQSLFLQFLVFLFTAKKHFNERFMN